MMDRLPPTARLIGIGWYFAVCIVAGVIGGALLDGVADTKPLLTLLGLTLGLVLAFYGGYQMLMDVIRPGKEKEE
ncbi:MAG: AtpZ/AtpI family protein [Chloroflexi bacterium]|nr:AtpZ/AtpI family protein [Chloroflexota bacterium]MCH8007777.1 AtpZ/AtpI family protein [Chloroflexota bacterium]